MAHDLQTVERERLYDTDYYAWTVQQAGALRAGVAGARTVDRLNLAEEIEDLGKSILRGCRSFVALIIEHQLKIRWVRAPESIQGWRGEIRSFRYQLEEDLTPSIENKLRLRLDDLYDKEIRVLVDKGLLTEADARLAKLEGPPTWARLLDPEERTEPAYD